MWWIDGAHDYRHVRHEALSAARQGSRLILSHDTDLPDVLQAAVDALTSPTTSDTDTATMLLLFPFHPSPDPVPQHSLSQSQITLYTTSLIPG